MWDPPYMLHCYPLFIMESYNLPCRVMLRSCFELQRRYLRLSKRMDGKLHFKRKLPVLSSEQLSYRDLFVLKSEMNLSLSFSLVHSLPLFFTVFYLPRISLPFSLSLALRPSTFTLSHIRWTHSPSFRSRRSSSEPRFCTRRFPRGL